VEASRPEPSDLIRSVSRAFRVLEAVGGAPGGLTVKQIARRCQLSLPTTYHLVRTLTYEGYLTRCNDGTYLVGLEVADRFRELAAAFRAPSSVEAELRRTTGETGYTHFLARFVEGRVAITAVTEGHRSPHLEDLIVGFDDGAHATALGKALLATLTPAERRRYLNEAGMRPFTPETITDPKELEYDITQRVVSGVYVERGQFRPGVACAATHVTRHLDPERRIVLACALPLEEFASRVVSLRLRLRSAASNLAAVLNDTNGTGDSAIDKPIRI